MRERGHVTAANGVAEVAVFGALQRNVFVSKYSQVIHNQGPPLLTWINFNPSMMSNYIHDKVWNQITYPFPNFNSATVESLGMDK